jgi:hypothetical protein
MFDSIVNISLWCISSDFPDIEEILNQTPLQNYQIQMVQHPLG